MSNSDKLIVVTGATGQQGGATAKHLLTQGWRVRALDRDPNRTRPLKRWLAAGAEVVSGDLDDRASLDRAFAGRTASSACRTFWLPELARLARCGRGRSWPTLPRQPESSISSTRRWAAPIARPACRISTASGRSRSTSDRWACLLPFCGLSSSWTILLAMMGPRTVCWRIALKPTTSLQMIAVDDIGVFAALAFARPQEFIGKAIEIAGDSLTMPQVADAMTRDRPAGAFRRAACGAGAQLQRGDGRHDDVVQRPRL